MLYLQKCIDVHYYCYNIGSVSEQETLGQILWFKWIIMSVLHYTKWWNIINLKNQTKIKFSFERNEGKHQKPQYGLGQDGDIAGSWISLFPRYTECAAIHEQFLLREVQKLSDFYTLGKWENTHNETSRTGWDTLLLSPTPAQSHTIRREPPTPSFCLRERVWTIHLVPQLGRLPPMRDGLPKTWLWKPSGLVFICPTGL